VTQFPNKSLHERKEAPDIVGTNGTGRKSKQWEGSMATISVVKHLTNVSNYGNLIIPLDMLNNLDVVIDKTDCWHHQDSMQRTSTILKVMKQIGIPHHDCSPNYF
jgi:hypothetical protein